MIATDPFPHHLPVPRHFEDHIVQQPFVRDPGIEQVLMERMKVWPRSQEGPCRNIIPYGFPPAGIMVLPGHHWVLHQGPR